MAYHAAQLLTSGELRFAIIVDRDRSPILVHINLMIPVQQSTSS